MSSLEFLFIYIRKEKIQEIALVASHNNFISKHFFKLKTTFLSLLKILTISVNIYIEL